MVPVMWAGWPCWEDSTSEDRLIHGLSKGNYRGSHAQGHLPAARERQVSPSNQIPVVSCPGSSLVLSALLAMVLHFGLAGHCITETLENKS